MDIITAPRYYLYCNSLSQSKWTAISIALHGIDNIDEAAIECKRIIRTLVGSPYRNFWMTDDTGNAVLKFKVDVPEIIVRSFK